MAGGFPRDRFPERVRPLPSRVARRRRRNASEAPDENRGAAQGERRQAAADIDPLEQPGERGAGLLRVADDAGGDRAARNRLPPDAQQRQAVAVVAERRRLDRGGPEVHPEAGLGTAEGETKARHDRENGNRTDSRAPVGAERKTLSGSLRGVTSPAAEAQAAEGAGGYAAPGIALQCCATPQRNGRSSGGIRMLARKPGREAAPPGAGSHQGTRAVSARSRQSARPWPK